MHTRGSFYRLRTVGRRGAYRPGNHIFRTVGGGRSALGCRRSAQASISTSKGGGLLHLAKRSGLYYLPWALIRLSPGSFRKNQPSG
ncbi:hypothetical protein [Corynebacterium renale]|uniref:hypothetical protein n=1 Tax=Corynebacterium renale TaxID=1724 RepID=UPI003D15FADE